MKQTLPSFACIASLLTLGLAAFCGVNSGKAFGDPPPAKHAPAGRTDSSLSTHVDYTKDILPLLRSRCYACHGNGTRLGGLQLDNRAALLKGGDSGPSVVVGDPHQSLLVKLVSGADAKRIMPARGPRLTASEIRLLSLWVTQGASFGANVAHDDWQPVLTLRQPVVPPAAPGSGLNNPIDLLLQPYFKQHKSAPAAVVADRAFARRAYLDLVGLLPSPEELRAFEQDTRPDKRAELADALLRDNDRYAEHWLSFWNDMLRNDYAGTGYIDGGRTQITSWLLAALRDNKPYDRFVSELVNPTPESAGFVNGIVWRGVVNASQTPPMQAAQNIGQVFMGVNLKCASCHDSFINNWKLADAYGMAGVYADKPLEMIRCDKPTGKIAPIKFMYAELGTIDGNAPRPARQAQLAALLTSKQNGRLARTFVNRLWAKLMGHGLVEPTDDMDRRPWSPQLLDWLASDFVAHDYDVKHTLRQIVTSRAYQMPAKGLASEQNEDFVFAGPTVKRLSAEQYLDAISTLTGVWQRPALGALQIRKGQIVLPQQGNAQIKFQSGLMRKGRADIDVDITGAETLFLIATDGGDGATLDWVDWAQPILTGPNGDLKLSRLQWRSATTGYGQIQSNQSIVQAPLRLEGDTYLEGIGTHANSVIAYRLLPGYTRFRAIAGPDTGATEQPNSQSSVRLYVVTGDVKMLDVRASLAAADGLMRALNRPNREQVVTERSTVATTLQALELTNGQILANILSAGADRWTRESGGNADALVTQLYLSALGRTPTPGEKQTALELVGASEQKAGVEDLLWAVVMLPEFQLVY